MATTASLDLTVWRNDDVYDWPLRVRGLDLTGVDLRMQVRLYGDAPGAPRVDLQKVAAAGVQGLRVAGVTMEGGMPVSLVRVRIDKATRQALPYMGAAGEPARLRYALLIGGVTRLTGTMIVPAHAYGSDGAPTSRPDGTADGASGMPASGATLTIAGEDVVELVIDGAGEIGTAVAAARASADRAAAERLAAMASATSAAASLTQTLSTAATAQAASIALGNLYPTIAAGLAATAADRYFAVAGVGAVFATVYRKTNGAAAVVNVLASQAALDGIGRLVPAQAGVDNALAINGALADPLVQGVILPAGDIAIASAIMVPTGKWLRGAGRGVTRIIGADNITAFGPAGKGLIVARDAVGVRVSDLTVVSPKRAEKIQGVWMLNTRDFLVERCEAYNCGYAFWAQEYSRDGVFRDIVSHNANVHFETTRAENILFENMVSDDGDGDNPLGVEAVWHCLFESKRITFRHGRHIGKGQPYLVVADTNSGADGLIDDIRFIDCDAVNTDGKICLLTSTFTGGSVGRVSLIDCDVVCGTASLGGVPAYLSAGKITITGGSWKSFSQESFILTAGVSLVAHDVDVDVTSAPEAYGSVYGGDPAASVEVIGGKVTLNREIVTLVSGQIRSRVSGTRVVSPKSLSAVYGVGERSAYSFAGDQALPSGGYDTIREGMNRAQFEMKAGAIYRLTISGRMRKTGASGQLQMGFDGTGGAVSGTIAIERGDGTMALFPATGRPSVPAGLGDVRIARIDATILGDGGTMTVVYGSEGVTLLAGASVAIERIQ